MSDRKRGDSSTELSRWTDAAPREEGNRFVKAHVHSVFHIPLDMGRKVMQSMRLIEAAYATAAHGPMLSEERSPWSSECRPVRTPPGRGVAIGLFHIIIESSDTSWRGPCYRCRYGDLT
jgi:hypothetical protein